MSEMANKKKASRWLTILILAGLGISASHHQVLTRTAEVSRALSPVLSSYEVIRMEPGEIERQVRTTGELRFRFNETDFYFNLQPHDMRSPNYRAVETGPGGVRRALPPQPVHTFKGVLAGREDTRGRFNLTGGGVEGVVYTPEGWVYVEPLRNYLPSAPAGELVVYRQADIKPGESFNCGVSLPKRLERGMDQVTAQVETPTSSFPINYVFDVATEADYEYVQTLGGSEEANREIEGILNQVEGVYQSELLLQLRISFQNTWTEKDDTYPYTARNAFDLLDEFSEYWNTHFAADVGFDIAHLWTDRDREDEYIRGLAHNSVVCSQGSLSYGMSSHANDIQEKLRTPAHEIGHNFGAVHPDEKSPPVTDCANTLMQSLGEPGVGMTFCQFSRKQIENYVSSNDSCLSTQPITLHPPTHLSAKATSGSRIDLSWQDNSTNETGFILQRRVVGSGHWYELGRTRADETIFSNKGLFSDATYIYRIQAFNRTEASAFSNEAAVTTLDDPDNSSDWIIDTIVGGKESIGDNGLAVEAQLRQPGGVAVDNAGNLYIAGNGRIRKVDTSGTITTIAGTGEYGDSGDGGPAVEAELYGPAAVAVDNAGNLYIVDPSSERIRRVDASGVITTIAGTGGRGYSGDGGPAVEAQLYGPAAVAVDNVGNLYIADTGNARIRRVDVSGIITTIAGTGERGYSGDNGPAVEAQFRGVGAVAVDNVGNLYIADSWNHRIRRVDASGIITTIAGTGEQGYRGDGGPALEAELSEPVVLAFDSSDNLYIADRGNSRIRRVDASGIITTIAGTGERGYRGDGGPALEAELYEPSGLAVDSSDNLYIADSLNHRIRRVDTSGTITTIAGSGHVGFLGGGYGGDNGPAVKARLAQPKGVAVDDAGNLYIADTHNHRIRGVDASGIITTIAGTGEQGYGGDGGPAHSARLYLPSAVAVDRAGNLYIADSGNHRIRKVDASRTITTIAGTGRTGFSGGYSIGGYSGDGGPAVEAELSEPLGLAVDTSGNLYIADSSNHRIRRIDASGFITTVTGTEGTGFSGGYSNGGYGGDGGSAVMAQLNYPHDVAADSYGSLYIADTWNHRIRRVDASGTITTIAGTGHSDFAGDYGPAVVAQLSGPKGVAIDGSGNLYIATGNHRIRRVDALGFIVTIVGPRRDLYFSGGSSGDGGPASEGRVASPSDVAVDSSGNVYIADTWNHRIRILTRPLESPTQLMATPISFQEIKLSWQDNSTDETGFRIQRRIGSSASWVEIGTTDANATTHSDTGLEPNTTYHYRVRAFRRIGFSDYSNEAVATTPKALPPTLTRFNPTSGPVGTQVTITGTHLLGATAVRFNAVPAARFEVVSETSIEAVVPPAATSGPVSLVTLGGMAVSEDSFSVSDTGIHSRLFVPIVLRTQGRTPGSFFTSELTLTNRGSATAAVHYTYSAAFGGGSGTAVDALEAGQQRVIPDAIAYLTALGIPIGSGSAGGTLVVDYSNLSSSSDAAVTVRVATPVDEGRGRAGLAFLGLNPDGLLTGPAFITGLRQTSQDRSNVALQNAGDAAEGSITLRVTVFSGDSASAGMSMVLPDRTLPPGGFYQFNRILDEAGFENGYVKVERVEGAAAFYAYGVINDNANSDGSFVFPVSAGSLEGATGQTLPALVEINNFTTELTLTNLSDQPRVLMFSAIDDKIETEDHMASFGPLPLAPGEQQIIPNAIQAGRLQFGLDVTTGLVAPLFASAAGGDMSGVVIGARVVAPADPEDVSKGQYGVFYTAVPQGQGFTGSARVDGLQQNEENRSNLALVNTGQVDDSSSVFEIDIYNGETAMLVKTVTMDEDPLTVVPAKRFRQINGILSRHAPGTTQGYVQIRKVSGANPFLAYGVVNDGGAPGERTGDGAYLPARE